MKQKVKLVFEKSYVEIPTYKDSFGKEIEIEIPQSINSDVRLVAARVCGTEAEDVPMGDMNCIIWNYNDESRLVGKLLTYIDATYSDKEQRQAHKDIIKDLVYGFCEEIHARGVQTIDAKFKN